MSAQICPRNIDILRQNFALAWSIICLAMLELSRYFARICSCFDTLILNIMASKEPYLVLDSDAEDADDGRSSAVQTAEFLSRFQPPKPAEISRKRASFRATHGELIFQYSSKHPGNSTIPQTNLMNFQNSSILCSNFAEQSFS